jgi:hypothetical protein
MFYNNAASAKKAIAKAVLTPPSRIGVLTYNAAVGPPGAPTFQLQETVLIVVALGNPALDRVVL